MGESHVPNCQPELKRGESGFLRCNETPKQDVESFRIKLCLMGVEEHAGSSLVDAAPELAPGNKTPAGLESEENSESAIVDEPEYLGQIDSRTPSKKRGGSSRGVATIGEVVKAVDKAASETPGAYQAVVAGDTVSEDFGPDSEKSGKGGDDDKSEQLHPSKHGV